MKNFGEQLQLTFTRNLEPIEETVPKPIPGIERYAEKMKAWEYLTNPERVKIYQDYLKTPGTRSESARGWCKKINEERGFPMTFWDPATPNVIHYFDTRQIENFVQEIHSSEETMKRAA